ncbi:MAG: hypothetical protein K5764_05100 [Prevotella sp.]|nr:hypothetical protein [Prevotella sp.]
MKKLVFMFVAVAAISFASCGNQAQPAQPVDTDSIEEVVDTNAVDTAAVDTAAADTAAAM